MRIFDLTFTGSVSGLRRDRKDSRIVARKCEAGYGTWQSCMVAALQLYLYVQMRRKIGNPCRSAGKNKTAAQGAAVLFSCG
ncbi:hypothetical protein HPT27_15225 [Permianibacter sp. IMCC34836]|uniref:hypothetical protein n=1 Tax=Permianibacter fluminis TaxID=2738515 RepID=UPI001553D9EA|nr:hypothetical protein [Permianibacter fluminis]NQD38378.1 hypothetical protein [Permianibacter fluminis]